MFAFEDVDSDEVARTTVGKRVFPPRQEDVKEAAQREDVAGYVGPPAGHTAHTVLLIRQLEKLRRVEMLGAFDSACERESATG